ncbi:HpaA family protein [Helicobacter acinonychis]|uniref:Neuraminyllactose-binding hemagglutinin n=1 Tax=Helicobacter acinonychis (strain Sheeba) TaxID=382638 RepID=Q17XN1_HELAH|nr:HpaA family protein [Helicobacter acinonychis]CAJ99595.1 Neuraminyllactose-binding hemagglutinin precursor [Helicobacter acinonychis str. Sheeba]STP04162.1 neuraminyllactose-binding hemagglutinin [Helicobacter acinonychis]
MERLFFSQKLCFKTLIILGLSIALMSCAKKPVIETTPQNEQEKPIQVTKTIQTTQKVTPINFNYPVHVAKAAPNHRLIGILAPNIQMSANLKSYSALFQNALLDQIQSIFEKRGYQTLSFKDENALTSQDKKKLFALLDVKGWVGVLEDLKIHLKDPNKPNSNALINQSSGSVLFSLYEPESYRVIYDFKVGLGDFQAIVQAYNNLSLGFNLKNNLFAGLEKNKQDAIHQILNKIYALIMKKAITELTEKNISAYKEAIDKMKGFKTPTPKKRALDE